MMTEAAMDERTYMVMEIDAAGDIDLFSTDNRDRAEKRYAQMLTTHSDVRANWRDAEAN